MSMLHYDNQLVELGYRKALNDIEELLYKKSFMEDSDMNKWDSGLWIRYKLFENALEELRGDL